MVDMTDRAITSNGDIIWLHIKKNNEVQINDADMDDDETNMLSPKRNSEFAKMTLSIDEKGKELVSMKVFGKDGGRYTLNIKDIIANKLSLPTVAILKQLRIAFLIGEYRRNQY